MIFQSVRGLRFGHLRGANEMIFTLFYTFQKFYKYLIGVRFDDNSGRNGLKIGFFYLSKCKIKKCCQD